jgi:hypothetical protein
MDAFECPVCHDVYVDPCTVVPCGHSACRHCLEAWLDRGNTRCPSCATTATHVVLSFALRTATESIHGSAVAARREALDLHQPGSFCRAVEVPLSFGRMRRELNLWPLLVVGGVGTVTAAGYYAVHTLELSIFTKISLVSAVGLAAMVHHVPVQGVQDVLAAMMAERPARLPPEQDAQPHQVERAPAGDGMLRRLADALPPGQLRALLAVWFMLFVVFFVVIQTHLPVSITGEPVEALVELARLLPGLLTNVFLSTFVVGTHTHTLRARVHVARRAAAVLTLYVCAGISQSFAASSRGTCSPKHSRRCGDDPGAGGQRDGPNVCILFLSASQASRPGVRPSLCPLFCVS